MWQKVFENDAFCGIMHETAAEQKESRSPETPADIVILFILMKLYNYLKERLCADKMTYIFLDEVQEVPSFEKVVDSLYIRDYVDVYGW